MKMLFNLVVVMLLASGLSFANNPTGTNPSTETVSYAVDLEASSIGWKAYKVTGEHMGTVKLKSGILMFEGGKLTGGQFEADMTSINVTDLTGEYKGKLEGHLKSDDFFGVEKNPTASLILTNVIPNGVDRYKIEGDLTIKGITKKIKFIANLSEEGDEIKAVSDLQIDRSEYNVRYGSGSFFDDLGDKTIYDEFDLTVNLVTRKK